MLKNLFKSRARMPGEVYAAPGAGRSVVISIYVALIILITWYLLTTFGGVSPIQLPSPGAVWDQFVYGLTNPIINSTLPEHTSASLVRVLSAFGFAILLAIPIGVMMGVNRVFRGVFDPIIEFYRPLPPLAYLPLIILWFGIDEFPKIFLIFLAIFAPMAISARAGVKSVSIEQIHAAYSMGASKYQIITHVILKSALPDIFTGMRIGIGVGWSTLVAAEMVASERGLGYMVLNASNQLASDIVFMGIILIGFFAFLFDSIIRYIEKALVPWKGKV